MSSSAYRNLRAWLRRLNETGRLAAIRPHTALRFELAGIANRYDGEKATLFPSPDNFSGTVVSGLLSNRSWMAEALGVHEDELLARFQNAVSSPLPWKELEKAPVHEVIDRSPDVRTLPAPTHNAHDNGAYITAGLMVVRDAETGRQNVAIHRLQISGERRLCALLLPRQTLAIQSAAEAKGEDLDVAIVIGASPAELLASQAIVPLGHDEFEIAGALCGQPIEMVKCLGSQIRVPADAEIVIEGRFLANCREPEGPFGEFPQYYGERADRHVIAIDTITTRSKPLFHTIVGGGLEHLLLGGIPREATILAELQRTFPEVRDVHLSRGGVCRYHLYIKLRKRFEGQAKNIISAAFATHNDIKHVVVVDEDVNIHLASEVEWAVATRFQADGDLVVLMGALGSKLDPSTSNGIGSKLGFDATKPLDAPEMRFKRIHVPGQEEIDLAEVSGDQSSVWDLIGASRA